MNNSKITAEPLQREIGGVKYVITRKYKENTSEDAASKMARIIRAEALRLMGDTQFATPKARNIKKI